MKETNPRQIVFTNKARCRDCYRCLRACPVKAIRMENGQASVVDELCIKCGTCIRECPQGAKDFRNDIELARKLIQTAGKVAVSLAPSFASVYEPWQQNRLASALRRLGFQYIAETAVGAYHVAQETRSLVADKPEQSHLCTACPVVVSYVERYAPKAAAMMVGVVSPMIAHARHLKQSLGEETRVVFIGPCVAKKDEAEKPANSGLVDCVLTFTELNQWLKEEKIDLAECEESSFDDQPGGDSRFFPLPGGLIRTANLGTDLLDHQIITVSGVEEIEQVLEEFESGAVPALLEPLFCPQGCVNGPGIPNPKNLFHRRHDLLSYAREHPGSASPQAMPAEQLITEFQPHPAASLSEVSEEEIRKVLAATGKSDPAEQLNCGACGYPTCRDKAIAVIRGMAETEMCIPYMRRLAEQRTDKIIQSSPNGIVMVDERLRIIHMNPAFKRFFMCSDAILGKQISYLIDPAPFEQILTQGSELVELTQRHDNYHLICHELFYPLPEENQLVGIFVNITRSHANEEKLKQLRSDTFQQARELLDHQIAAAQQLTRYLGETTARGEELVRNLLELADDQKTNQRS